MTSSIVAKSEAVEARQIANGMWEVSPSKQNREALFSQAVTAISSSQEEAQIVLSNLQRLFPDLGTDFGARTSGQVYDTPFKVICESDNGASPFAEGQPLRQYLAVSYSWRHAEQDWPAEIPAPYPPWPFSKVFVEAVLSERGVDSAEGRNAAFRRECVFVDAMCIDQTNQYEKQRSIAMMDVIYKSCRKLMILLEDVVFTDEEVAAVARIGFEQIVPGATHRLEEADVPHLNSAWRKIEASRWWGRSWCWHEFEVNEPWDTLRCSYYAHCATFVMRHGDGTFKVNWLQLLWIRAMTGSDGPHTAEELRNATRWAIADNRISRHGDLPFRRKGTSRSSIMARLYVLNSTEATIPADLISIAINLSGLALYYKGRSVSRPEVIWIVTTLALAAGEKSPLAHMKDEMLMINGKESWLSHSEVDFSIPTFTLDGNTGLHTITPHSIELDLFFFEHVVEWPSAEDIALTDQIFPHKPILSTPTRTQAGFPSSSVPLTDDISWDPPRRNFLAQICRSGLTSTLTLWNQLQREVVQESYNNNGKTTFVQPFQANESLRPNARVLLQILLGSSSEEEKEAHLETTLLLLLTWLTDPRSMYYISAFCLRIPCAAAGHHHYALLTNIILRKEEITSLADTPTWRIAIPTDLVGSSCQVYRAWILRPVGDGEEDDEGESVVRQRNRVGDGNGVGEDGDGNGRDHWRLVGKMLLLGEGTTLQDDDDGEFVRLRRRQVVMA